jgi:hypothetical protein
MGPEWVAGGQTRVHEIIGWIMPHFEALHESPRPRVVACGEGNDLPQGVGMRSDREHALDVPDGGRWRQREH